MEPQQDIDEVIRPRLQQAIDEFIAAGHAKSLRQIGMAVGGKTFYDHLAKYLRGGENDPGMSTNKIRTVATYIRPGSLVEPDKCLAVVRALL